MRTASFIPRSSWIPASLARHAPRIARGAAAIVALAIAATGCRSQAQEAHISYPYTGSIDPAPSTAGTRPQPSPAATGEPVSVTLQPAGTPAVEPGAELLPLRETRVRARIDGPVARVVVAQTFANRGTQPIEAVYVFPLPHDAAVSGFVLENADRRIVGQVRRREEARQVYEEARAAGMGAALLDQERPDVFMQRVANLVPGAEVRVETTLDILLAPDSGRWTFAFPTVVGPRFVPPGAVADFENHAPRLKPGSRNPHELDLEVELQAGADLASLDSPSSRIEASGHRTANGAWTGPVRVRLLDASRVPDRDFVLEWKIETARPAPAILAWRDRDTGAFALVVHPPEADAAEIQAREIIFVVDCSGSMSGEPIARVRQAMRHALPRLRAGDRFQVIRFDQSASPLSPEPLEVDPENVRAGLSYVDGLSGGGGTMMIEGIRAAMDTPQKRGTLRIVCLMTDGYIGNDAEIIEAVKTRIGRDTRFFAFGIGSSVNRHLLDNLARVGRGTAQYILLDQAPEPQIERFLGRIDAPVLTDIRLGWNGVDISSFEPEAVPDLFAGQPLVVAGRYLRSGRGTLTVSGLQGGRRVSFTVPVELPEQGGNPALAGLWARRRIARLEEREPQPSAETAAEIAALALRHHLASAYTSFVAVDQRIVNEGGRQKTVEVPLEMPAGVSYEGVFGDGVPELAVSLAAPPPSAALRLGGGGSGRGMAKREATSDRSASNMTFGAGGRGRGGSTALVGSDGGAVPAGGAAEVKTLPHRAEPTIRRTVPRPIPRDLAIEQGGESRSPESILRVLRAHVAGLRYSVAKHLRSMQGEGASASPQRLADSIVVRIVVEPSGEVASATLVGPGTGRQDLDAELLEKIARARFDAVAAGEVAFRWTLRIDDVRAQR